MSKYPKMKHPNADTVNWQADKVGRKHRRAVEQVLEATDDLAMKEGSMWVPSALLITPEGEVSPVFWRTCEKYKLRRPGETDEGLIKRQIELAHKVGGQDNRKF